MRAQTGAQIEGLSRDGRACFNVMNGLPITAAVSEVLALLELSLLKSAAHTGVAGSINPEAEPRAGNTNLSGVTPLHHTIVGVRPFLHSFHKPRCKYICTTTGDQV